MPESSGRVKVKLLRSGIQKKGNCFFFTCSVFSEGLCFYYGGETQTEMYYPLFSTFLIKSQQRLVWQWYMYTQTKLKWWRKGKVNYFSCECIHVISCLHFYHFIVFIRCHLYLLCVLISNGFGCWRNKKSHSHWPTFFFICESKSTFLADLRHPCEINSGILQGHIKDWSVKLIKNRADLDSLLQLMGLQALVLLLMQLKRGGNSQHSSTTAT